MLPLFFTAASFLRIFIAAVGEKNSCYLERRVVFFLRQGIFDGGELWRIQKMMFY